jgi:hypothetical protein
MCFKRHICQWLDFELLYSYPNRFGLFLIACANILTIVIKIYGKMGHPCQIVGLKYALACPLLIMHVSISLHGIFTHD